MAHCGGNSSGSFLNTLVLTDIASSWTEFVPLLNKSGANVVSGIEAVKQILPFKLRGVDTDNGSEFINYELLNYCKSARITFTRSRAYRKNDQAHVEEKNGSIVRRLVGYDRYEGEEAWHALADLYAVLRLYVNYFQPSLKLISKTRDGSKVTKEYDRAQTPCQRLLASDKLSKKAKKELKQKYETLDPVDLLARLRQCQEIFWGHAWATSTKTCKTVTDSIEHPVVAIDAHKPIISGAKANTKYRCTKKPRKKLAKRTWRTCKDPFEFVWDRLCLELSANPHYTGKMLLDKLIVEQPDQFSYKQLRTLQRRIAHWRATQSNNAKLHHIALSQDDVTQEYVSLVMG